MVKLYYRRGLDQYKDLYHEVYLEVDGKNDIGIAFYKKEGFEVIREYEELLLVTQCARR